MKSQIITGRSLIMASACVLSIAGMMLLVSCESGGSSGSAGSTISGNVSSFSGAGAFYTPEPRGNWLRETWAVIAEAVVSPAHAAVAGVTVKVAGTDIQGVTDDNGNFVLFDVPAGERELLFSFGNDTVSLMLSVPENAKIELENVKISNDAVDMSNLEIEIEIEIEDEFSDDEDSSSLDGDSLDDDSLDDDSLDEDSLDDDSEDSEDSESEDSEDSDSLDD